MCLKTRRDVLIDNDGIDRSRSKKLQLGLCVAIAGNTAHDSALRNGALSQC
jgi:hypothetical protein